MAWVDFTSSPHGGQQKALPEAESQPPITPTTIIDHSIVGSASGAYYYFRDSTGIEAHFILCGKPSGTDGRIWQLMNTAKQADANQDANAYAISIETEDNGDPNNYPWSQAQLDSLIWLHDTLVAYHPSIPRREATSCTSGGLGYHSKMGAPSCWTPSAGKTCPGKPVRVDQWTTILLPAFLSGEAGGGADLNQAQHDQLKRIRDGFIVQGSTGLADTVDKLYQRAKTIRYALETQKGAVTPEQTMEDLYGQIRSAEQQVKALCDAAGVPFELVDTSQL